MKPSLKRPVPDLEVTAWDFSPAILQAQHAPPLPLPRFVLYTLLALFAVLLAWAILGRLDIVAVAQGKLVPETFLKVVQPSDSGVVKEILVKEGDRVATGQVLMRMDMSLSVADGRVLETDLELRKLQLRRIDAELAGAPFTQRTGDDPALFSQVEGQHRSHRQAYQDALDTERAARAKAQHDLQSAMEVEAKLKQTLPIYREQEKGWFQLAQEGYAGTLMALDRTRSRIETEQELQAQTQNVESLKAGIAQSNTRLAQITSNYRQQLHNERIDAESQHSRLNQELVKQTYKQGLLELRAPQGGIVKDLATHTRGTVVTPGTVLLTLVPHDEPLLAEVWVSNSDSGFVEAGQKVKLKLEAYPFQRYGMLDGSVRHVTYDATDKSTDAIGDRRPDGAASEMLSYRALVALDSPRLEARDGRYRLTPGMQVAAEIHLGNRSVIDYLLSPIQKTVHEAWRER